MCKAIVENSCYGCSGDWCFIEKCEEKKLLGDLTPADHVVLVDEKANMGRMKGGVCRSCTMKLNEKTFRKRRKPDQDTEATKEA